MKKQAKQPGKFKTCSAKTKAGTACQRPVQAGTDKCFFHNGGAKTAGDKGRAAMSATMQRINSKLAELDLRSPEVQKRHLACLIVDALGDGESLANVARLYQLLISLTKEADPTQHIVVERVINVPGSKDE